MEAKRCPNGHYYDSSRYAVCPACGEYNIGGSNNAAPHAAAVSADPAKDYNEIPPTMPFLGNNAEKNQNRHGANLQNRAEYPGAAAENSDPDMNATVAYNENKLGFVPTVGWVICISGPQKGKDFRIVTGYNKIGRTGDSNICLSEDNQVSRESHAIIAYEPNSRKFYVAGDKNMIYLNGNFVIGGQELKANDRIKVGATELMFVPLCGESFEWE